jgi:ubiquinone/menaquinone biosynthesis C-methylase UbiE
VSTFPTDNTAAWDRYAAAYHAAARFGTEVVHYAPDVPTEASLRLLGDVKGRRVLDLGCGGGQDAIALAKQGATVIGVDASAELLAIARRLAEQEGVKVELRHGDLADLAFVQSDSIDLVLSASALEYIEDIGRVFRQVHRVLKVGAPLVLSTVHPAWRVAEGRSYFDRGPIEVQLDGVVFTEYAHTFADLALGLARANFRVETILEPEPDTGGPRSAWWHEAHRTVPRTIVLKARKEGN